MEAVQGIEGEEVIEVANLLIGAAAAVAAGYLGAPEWAAVAVFVVVTLLSMLVVQDDSSWWG